MGGRTLGVRTLLGILGFLLLWITAQAQMKIPLETVQQWASVISVQLREVSTKYSGSLLLQKKLKDVEPIVKIVELNGDDLVKDYSDEIERMLGSKMKSVKRLAESAEDADLYHEYNASLEFDYYNAMLINTADEDGNTLDLGGDFPLEENEHFNNMPVNTQQSDIQVPTNVYNKDPNILNAIYNSEALNDVFIGNFQKDPTLTWQYFGSSTGFFRVYPGIKWTPDANGVAAFDCRNRNWYIQAATSPKDIIIMVDISGSMKGLKMTIAKHTINTILDTLGENDFVNVIAYTDYVRYVEPCFRGTLVQADLDNREHFKLLVEDLHVKGEAKIKKAMKESFKILNEARANGQGSMCNQAIMLITDGAMEDFESVFQEFNWPERRVRVFTYLIGREMTFAQNTKWIACNNKGYYTHISTLADVQENVMEYLHVLSRPMVINHDHDIIWTEAYMDTVLFTTKAQSLLLMTSVAMPVFSKKKETLSHGILLGVVGTDIPLMEVMKLAPRYMLGAHGYAFLITNNGYILAHPDLRPLYKDGKKLKPKPNYNSVDLAEVEWEDTEETLRTAMVRGSTGQTSLSVRASVDKGKRPLYLVNDYFFTNIDETPFSFGMVLTKGHGRLMFMGNVSVEEGLHDLTSPDLSIASEWTYCETDIDPAHRKYSQLQAAIRYLLGKEPDLECDEVLLQQTLFDAVVTAPLEAYWNALMLSDKIELGVETAFLGTRAGLMRIFRYAGVEKRMAKRFLTASDKDNLFTMDHFPLWYRLAVENTPGSFFYYAINDKGSSPQRKRSNLQFPHFYFLFLTPEVNLSSTGVQYVVAATAVTVSSEGRTAVAGAIGLQFSLDWMEKRFWDITKQPSDTDCSNVEGVCPLNCESFDLNCFVVDNNGFVLLSKERSEVGKFFGAVDGSVMASLIKMGMYKKVSLFDYQAMCKNSHHHASSARPLLSPFYGIVALLRWIFSNALMFLLDFNFCGLWHSDYFVDAKAGYHTTHKQKKVEALQPCDTAYPGFMYDYSIKEANSLIKCGRCQKMFVVQQIPNSNLVLVVTQADCDCSRQYGPILLDPKEIKYIL
ncbi:voltage-dependent calcium channel subunit alpha-2/delta-4-like [Xyrichtys novacula]|uniref:Voltage-dependent calcium channel subunit alpha-2/delta-4-like n=1 Tax=Xyrichtys novacula TaxID=13765 RepID=A0AAV1F5M5_XYRNO|nr:voltage-dependent calcium channel subunit alpha-2/delta-4-like [Xyrichtys novacula]